MGVGYTSFHKVNPLGEGRWHAYNYILDILVEQGIIGFLFFLAYTVTVFRGIKEKHIAWSVFLIPLMLLFDDLSWSYSMAIVLFFLYAQYFSHFPLKADAEV